MNLTRQNKNAGWMDKVLPVVPFLATSFVVLLFAYVFAALVNLFLMGILINSYEKVAGKKGRKFVPTTTVTMGDRPNYKRIRDSILDRNIFNQTGEVPEESFGEENTKKEGFSEVSPCSDLTLPIKITGVILVNSGDSVLAVLENGLQEPDFYRVGDAIIGNDSAFLHSIDDEKAVFNNSGNKECHFFFRDLLKVAQQSPSSAINPTVTPGVKKPDVAGGGSKACQDVTLSSDFVRKELGPGGSKITTAANIVPNLKGGVPVGFKIFAIKGGSLFSRICLKNQDIIQSVNDVSLQQLDKGFAIYDAFQNAREVRINFLRAGNPMSVVVRIRG